MTNFWQSQFRYDPLAPILSSGKHALIYFTRRDLLGEDVGPIERLWQLPEAQKILKKQLRWQLASQWRAKAPGDKLLSHRDLALVQVPG